MKRYLLFDSGCSLCTELAEQIASSVDGWLTARSLREPEVQALLNQTQSDWSWQPTLLEVEGQEVRAFTGFSLRRRLLLGLGPQRAWHVARLVSQAGISPVNMGNGGPKSLTSRRSFLRGTVQSAAALMAAKVLTALPEGKEALAQSVRRELSNHVYLPHVSSGRGIRELTAEEASLALSLVLNSSELATLQQKNEPLGIQLNRDPQSIELIGSHSGHNLYGADKQSVLLLGEEEGHRFCQVFLGTERLNSDSTELAEETLFVAFVETTSKGVLEIYQIDVISEEARNNPNNSTIKMKSASGREREIAIQNGEATLIRDSQLQGREVQAPDEWWLNVLCLLLAATACGLECYAICQFSGGLVCYWCPHVCAFFFTICGA
jgi:hypothetical protein